MTNLVDSLLDTQLATVAAPETFKRGQRQETDKERIDRQQAAINQAFGEGTVGRKKQFFDNGHETDNAQAAEMEAEHKAKFNRPAAAVIKELRDVVEAEGRKEVVLSTKEISQGLHLNGKLTLNGLQVRMHAVEQMLARSDSSATKYVLNLREQIIAAQARGDEAAVKSEKARLIDTLRHEIARAGDTQVRLRVREGSIKDIYAAVGPAYGDADFPKHANNLIAKLGDTPANYTYDAKTTAWNLRAEVWTPTPAASHKVGEPIKGGMSIRGADRGDRSILTAAFIMCVRCCNYSTYSTTVAKGKRAHRGNNVVENVLVDIASATKAIDVLCNAWGVARVRELERPAGFKGTDRDLVANVFRGVLRNDGSPLQGVVPGRTENHVEGLLAAWETERRDINSLILADLQQAVTRFSQSLAPEVRADLDAAAGEWMVEHLGVPVERAPAMFMRSR